MTKPRKRRKLAETLIASFFGPTAEREAHNDFTQGGNLATSKTDRAGTAFKMTPVIDTLHAAGKLSQAHWNALSYYRDQAHRAEDDCAQEGTLAPAKIMGGGNGTITGGHIPARLRHTPAIAETGRIERELGALWEIARAIAVDDMTLTRWCIKQHGGRERFDKGVFVAMVPYNPYPVGEPGVIERALFELRSAATRIVR